MKTLYAIAVTALLMSCGKSMQVGENHYLFETTYPNGAPKTRFYLKNGGLSDTLKLFAKDGGVSLDLNV